MCVCTISSGSRSLTKFQQDEDSSQNKNSRSTYVVFKILVGGFLYTCNNGYSSDFIWDFRKLPFSPHLGKYFIKVRKISAKIHEIGKIKAIFGLGMTPI